jgi:membrane-associated phospholipid phosphatase
MRGKSWCKLSGMFQIEPIQFLQSLASAPLTCLMTWISLMGYPAFYAGAGLVIMLAFDMRKGFVLLHLLVWTAIVTEYLKELLRFPRPWHVHSGIRLLDSGAPNTSPFLWRGASRFFEPPDRQIMESFRSASGTAYGFPSGHVSSTAAFWGGLGELFSRRFLAVAAVMSALMAVSRMYLGKHFLADVLGGVAVGAAAVAALRLLLRNRIWKRWSARAALRAAYLLILPPALLLFGFPDAVMIGQLFGLDCAYLLFVRQRDIPSPPAGVPLRAARVLVGVALFAGLTLLLRLLPMLQHSRWPGFLCGAVPVFVALQAAVRIGRGRKPEGAGGP